MAPTFSMFVTALATFSLASAKIYFKEDFSDAGWEKRWTASTEWKPKDQMGAWSWTAGTWFDEESNKGIKTSEDAKHYGLSAKLDAPFTNKDKELVVQFVVKHEQDLDCGGAYIKLLGDTDQAKFGGDSPYQIMFGPDVCGPSERRTHVIFHYPPKNENLLIKNEVKVETDNHKHLYTLVVLLITPTKSLSIKNLLKKANLKTIGTFYFLKLFLILRKRSLQIGWMQRKSLILRTKNLKGMMIFQLKFLILKLQSLRIGMMLKMVHGKLLLLTILHLKVHGSLK